MDFYYKHYWSIHLCIRSWFVFDLLIIFSYWRTGFMEENNKIKLGRNWVGSNAIFIGQRMGNNEGIASRMNMMDFRDIISINRLTNLNIVSSNNTPVLTWNSFDFHIGLVLHVVVIMKRPCVSSQLISVSNSWEVRFPLHSSSLINKGSKASQYQLSL